MNIAKLRVQWTHDFGSATHATLWAAGARSFDETTDFMAAVPMAGVVAPDGLSPNTWAEYGGRLNFALSPQVAGDLTFAGSQVSRGWKQPFRFVQVRALHSECSTSTA
jgi:hypothetical protein